MKFKALLLSGLAFGLVAVPASGHHVSPLIDYEKKVEVSGTIKQFRWTNPHSRMILTAADQGGQMAEWDLEMASPGTLSRKGWSPKLVAPGERVTVTIYPMKDGTPGGQLFTVKLPDGRVVPGE